MPRKALFLVPLLAACWIALTWSGSPPVSAAPDLPRDAVGFRIVFGDKRDQPADYSGSISLSAGRVVRLTPWRFLAGDAIQGSNGWKLQVKRLRFENQPDKPIPLMTEPGATNIVPAGIVVTVEAPLTAVARLKTAQGSFEVPLKELGYGRILRHLDGDVLVQRTPVAEQVSPPSTSDPAEHFDYPAVTTAGDGAVWLAWQGYRDEGDHVYARHWTASGWSQTDRLTERKGDIFRTAIGQDARGRIWVVWSERTGQQWDLYARSHDGRSWSSRRKLTSANYPNVFHRLVADRSRNLHLIWVGHKDGQSYVHWSRLEGDTWTAPKIISGPSAWNPEGATDSSGALYVAWDSYRQGNYDIYLRRIASDGTLGEERQVTRSNLFQTHPTVAVDKQDRVWLAWHESGANWGKDWTHEDSYRATVLYTDRRPRVAVLEGGQWKQPVAEVMSAVPMRYRRYVEYPRIVADGAGRIWLGLQLRTGTANNRADYWAFDGRWEYFLTTLEGSHWTPLMPVPQSSFRPEVPLALEPARDSIRLAWTNDNRPLQAPSFYGLIPSRHEIFTAAFAAASSPPAPRLGAFTDPEVRSAAPVHPNEREDVARIRGYRATVDGATLRILRGDFHRHTEISSDGSGDGSLEDYFRYMIDAAAMDTGIVADHNAGNNDEYSWWRTEKAIDLFLIPGRYTPMFGYERSPGYPNGHRNVVFAHRGTHTLPISPEEMRGKVRSGPILYPYLHKNGGIGMVHSSATSQGTDWGDNDPQVEPLVELYQGYHASYEYEGAPRAESDRYRVSVHGRYEPLGFWWNALAKGYKVGVQASSDHISTHTSYTLIYSPSASRTDILESMRRRHAYAATDNIIIDFQAEAPGGRTYMMGDAFASKAAPNFRFKITGADVISHVDIVKDGKFVYHAEPHRQTVEFSFRDTAPGNAESYYYVRVQQLDRNLAWSSPIWVNYH